MERDGNSCIQKKRESSFSELKEKEIQTRGFMEEQFLGLVN